MPGKCLFRTDWIHFDSNKDWKVWLRPVDGDKYKAYCNVCRTKFDVAYGGISSVKKHEKGKRHSTLIEALVSGKQTTLQFNAPEETTEKTREALTTVVPIPTAETATQRDNAQGQAASNISTYLIKDEVTKAEIMWALQTVKCHSSMRSSGDASNLFAEMFHDSAIAQKFQMHKDKIAYVVAYGLGPYFQNMLVDQINTCTYFAVSFDESLNKVSQKGQMDLVVRHWDNGMNAVSTRYLTSAFLEHATADDLVESFTSSLVGLGLSVKKIIQISMDGPNVNLKFLRDLKEMLKEGDDSPEMFDVGTCSLHIVHGAYKTAHNKTGWVIHKFLRTIYYLFKDYPSRRADYCRYSGSSKFPRKFCSIRWIENTQVIDRALEMIPHLKKYADAIPRPPATKNFGELKLALTDVVLQAKLEFLRSVGNEVEPFLTNFQSNDALLPFMYRELYFLLHSIGSRFIKKSVMNNISNPVQLLKVDISNPSNIKNVREVDIGFGATQSGVCRGVSELDILSFRKDCRDFLVTMFTKLIEKCPLKSKIVRGASCISPDIMLSESLRVSRVTSALEEFVSKGHMAPSVADRVKKEYLYLCETPSVQEQLKAFHWRNGKLDSFLMNLLHDANVTYTPMVTFFQKLLTMFHGNAAVERCFSVNKECLVENLMEQSLIAQRAIYGAISACGKLTNIQITKAMIFAVRNASSRRKEALAAKKVSQETKECQLKRAAQDLKLLESKKKMVLEKRAEELNALNEEITTMKKKMKN